MSFEQCLERQDALEEDRMMKLQRRRRMRSRTREERRLERQLLIAWGVFALVMAWLAYMALRATFGG